MIASGPELVRAGLVDAAALVDGQVTVRQAGGKTWSAYAVENSDGPSWFVKQPDLVAGTSETAVLQWLHAAGGPLVAHLPAIAPGVEHEGRLVLAMIDGEDLARHHARTIGFAERLGEATGRALAAVHEHPAPQDSSLLRPRRPTCLLAARPDTSLYCSLSRANIECLRAIRADGGFEETLDRIGEEWTPDSVCHGDIRLANLIVERGRAPEAHVRIIDWESACLGDPCWDMARLFGEYVSLWLASTPNHEGVPIERAVARAGQPIGGLQPGLRGVWRGYRSSRALSNETAAALLRKTVRWTCAALIEVVLSFGQVSAAASAQQMLHLRVARELGLRPVELGVRLLGLPYEWLAA